VKVTKQKKVLPLLSDVSNHTSCTQIFQNYNILKLSSLHIPEVICFIQNLNILWQKKN
jgi:hypothetical protein